MLGAILVNEGSDDGLNLQTPNWLASKESIFGTVNVIITYHYLGFHTS